MSKKNFLLLFFVIFPLFSYCQIKGTFNTTYFFNTEVGVFKTNNGFSGERIDANYHKHLMINGGLLIPFNTFDKESPLYSNIFSVYTNVGLLTDLVNQKHRQSYWNFGLEAEISKKEPIYAMIDLNAIQVLGNSYEGVVWDGVDIRVGLGYNNNKFKQELDNIVNFYGEMTFVLHHKYDVWDGSDYSRDITLDYTNTINNEIGAVINLFDLLYIEQNINFYTEQFLFKELTMSPFHSDFLSKVYIKPFNRAIRRNMFSNMEIWYEHICYHPIVSANNFVWIEGVINNIGIKF